VIQLSSRADNDGELAHQREHDTRPTTSTGKLEELEIISSAAELSSEAGGPAGARPSQQEGTPVRNLFFHPAQEQSRRPSTFYVSSKSKLP
jgi:hypothetical protein